MENSRTKNSVRNVATGMIFRIISLLVPFIIRTIIIKKLGLEYLGLNSLFSSVLQVLSLSELGFSTAIAFSMYKPVAEGDKALICGLLKLLRKIYRIIGLVILVLGLALMPALPYLIAGSYPQDINLYVLYLIYLFNTVISYFLFAYKGVLLTAYQRSDIENNISSLVFLGMYAIQIAVLFLFQNYYIYIIFLPISTIIINIVRAIMCKRMYPEYVCEGIVPAEVKKSTYNNIKALIGHRISTVVVTSTDNIFISVFLGLNVLAIYNNYFYIVNALLGVIGIFYASITASIGNSITTESVDKNYNDFNKLTYVNVWLMGWMAICLVCLYQHFMFLWVGEELMLPMLTVMLFVIYFYSWRFKDMLSTYKDAAGMWKIDFWKPYVVSAANLVLDFVFVKYFGVNGVLLATIISVPIISLPWETQAFFKNYFKRSAKKYYLRLLLYTVILCVIGAITYFLCYLLPSIGYGWFILKIVICLFVPNILIVACSFWTSEFKWLKNKVFSLLRRKSETK